MPLTPAIRPVAHIRSTADRPINAPPTSEATGVKDVAIMINPIWRGRFAIGDVLIPLRRNDPVVALIHGALAAHGAAYAAARRAVHLLRK